MTSSSPTISSSRRKPGPKPVPGGGAKGCADPRAESWVPASAGMTVKEKSVPANMIVLAAGDNVGVALRTIAKGEMAADRGGTTIAAHEEIPQGHKIALRPIADGKRIMRLGVAVGIATHGIAAGHLVHIHNVRSQYLDNAEDHYE